MQAWEIHHLFNVFIFQHFSWNLMLSWVKHEIRVETSGPGAFLVLQLLLTRKRELVALLLMSSWCLVTVNVLPWVGQQCVIVVFPDHTHFLFAWLKSWKQGVCVLTTLGQISCSYRKTCVKRPLSKRQKNGFQDWLLLNAGQKYCRMLQREHSAILLTFIRLPIVIKTSILSIFGVAILHRFYAGFTQVLLYELTALNWKSSENSSLTLWVWALPAQWSGM